MKTVKKLCRRKIQKTSNEMREKQYNFNPFHRFKKKKRTNFGADTIATVVPVKGK